MRFDKRFIDKNTLNKGSTLVTVIVVVAFMSILATILIYVVGENYKTKIYDIKNKESFYEAEIIAERIKASLIKDVIKASKPAYDSIVVDYSQSANEEVRATSYFESFQVEFIKVWEAHWNHVNIFDGSHSTEDDLKSLFGDDIIYDESKPNEFKLVISGHTLICTFQLDHSIYRSDLSTVISNSDRAPVYADNGDVASYYIKGFKVTVLDEETDYVSVIESSFQVTPPQLNWGETVRNDDKALDYSKCVKYYKYVKK